MSSLPLVSHAAPDSVVAWRADGAVTLQQFLSEVRQLATLFPIAGHLLNMCSDRYRFSVGLAAAIMAGKVSLLPSSHTPETVRQIKVFAPDVFCLTDSEQLTANGKEGGELAHFRQKLLERDCTVRTPSNNTVRSSVRNQR